MAKRKAKKEPVIRYIVRAYKFSKNVRKVPLDKQRSKFSQRKDVKAKVHVSDRDRNRIYSAAKIVGTVAEARKFVDRIRREFKKEKHGTHFSFKVQPFKGKVSTSRIRVYLQKGAQSMAASGSKATKKKASDATFHNERERVLRNLISSIESGEFYAVEKSYGKRKRQRSQFRKRGKPK